MAARCRHTAGAVPFEIGSAAAGCSGRPGASVAFFAALASGFSVDLGPVASVAAAGICTGMPSVPGTGMLAIGSTAAFLVPAGIGVREAALAWFLAGVLAPAPAALLAIAARLLLTLAELLSMLAGLSWLRIEAARTRPHAHDVAL